MPREEYCSVSLTVQARQSLVLMKIQLSDLVGAELTLSDALMIGSNLAVDVAGREPVKLDWYVKAWRFATGQAANGSE